MNWRPETLPVLGLAFGQFLTYAGVYYAFPALLPHLLADTGWTAAQLAAGPTLSFLMMAAVTPFTGRLVDRGWGGEMLTYLPVMSAIPLAFLGVVGNFWGYLALWSVIGVAQAGMYYETCFSFLTRRLGDDARRAITLVTLVAGFASTFAFPLGHWLGDGFGAARAFMVFAALIPAFVLPVTFWSVRRLRAMARAAPSSPARIEKSSNTVPDPKSGPKSGPVRLAMRQGAFWAMAAMFALMGLNHAIVVTFALILFRDFGADPATAALAASCIGPAQVLGRLVLVVAGTRIDNALAICLSVVSLAVAGLALIFGGGSVGLIFAFAGLQGAGIGVFSILRPVLIADFLGRSGFGAVSGAIAISPILAAAIGPFVGAQLLAAGGADLAIRVAFGLAVLGACVGLFLAWMLVDRRRRIGW